jgi:ABC-type proline/glycine betaine transport system permease subunit
VVCLQGPWWKRGAIVGLALAGFMSFQLLLPNPLMPWGVGAAHFLETFPSNALFGLLATGVLMYRRASS